ncbi:MAG: DNA adenine methylase [Pseudomonadota bacterium]
MKPLSSPLRYPGSKATLVEWMSRFLQANDLIGSEFVELYAGSAALSLNLLKRGDVSSVMLFERDPLLFAFWYCVFNQTESLIQLIEQYEPGLETREVLGSLLKLDDVSGDLPLLGYAGLLFNRTSFSGVLHAGPIGGAGQQSKYKVDCRFNRVEITQRIRECSELAPNVSVYFGDAVKALKDANSGVNGSRVFYVDPPYYVQGPRLYRYHYKFADHVALAEALTDATYRWILSYDDHPAIRHLYREFPLVQPSLRYSSKVPKKELELLFTNIEEPNFGSDANAREAKPRLQLSRKVSSLSSMQSGTLDGEVL